MKEEVENENITLSSAQLSSPSKLIKFSHLKNIFVILIIFFVSKEDKAKLFKLIQKEKLILFTLLIFK